jgi:hypothetical protein
MQAKFSCHSTDFTLPTGKRLKHYMMTYAGVARAKLSATGMARRAALVFNGQGLFIAGLPLPL